MARVTDTPTVNLADLLTSRRSGPVITGSLPYNTCHPEGAEVRGFAFLRVLLIFL